MFFDVVKVQFVIVYRIFCLVNGELSSCIRVIICKLSVRRVDGVVYVVPHVSCCFQTLCGLFSWNLVAVICFAETVITLCILLPFIVRISSEKPTVFVPLSKGWVFFRPQNIPVFMLRCLLFWSCVLTVLNTLLHFFFQVGIGEEARVA